MTRITMNLTASSMASYNIAQDLARKINELSFDLEFLDMGNSTMRQAPFESIMRCYQNGDLTLKEVAALIPLCNQAPWIWTPVIEELNETLLYSWLAPDDAPLPVASMEDCDVNLAVRNAARLCGASQARHIVRESHVIREAMHARPDIGLRNILISHTHRTQEAEAKILDALYNFSRKTIDSQPV